MNRNVKRLLALTLLAALLMFPAAMPKARESADPPTEMVRAVRRVRMARIPRDQAETVQMLGPLRGVVSAQGRLIRPYDGSALWQLSNGSFGIFGDEPTVQAMETWTKDLGDGVLYFVVCYCPTADPFTGGDRCGFNPPGDPNSLCGGPLACCTKVEGTIDANGVVVFL
jgi:hypothetical protein